MPNHNRVTFGFMKQKRAIGLIVFMIVLFVAGWLGRNILLQWVFKREQTHLKTTMQLNLSAGSVSFVSWNSIQLTGLCLQPEGEDTLAIIQNIWFKPSMPALLTGKLNFREISIDGATINVFNGEDHNNLSFLKSNRQEQKNNAVVQSNYYAVAKDLQSKFLKMLNTAVEINCLQINYRDTAFVEHIYMPRLVYNKHNLSGLVINQPFNDTLVLNAEVLEKSKDYKLNIQHRGNALCYLPFLDAQHGLKCRFESVSVELKLDEGREGLHISPHIEVQNFHLQHWRLAKNDVVFPQAQFTGLLKIKEGGMELDSSSTVTLNHATCKVFASYQTKPDTTFAINIDMPEMASDTFFNALPEGMFNTLKGISCSGTLTYDLRFFINTRQPDSLIFDSQLKRKNFHIIHHGEEDYGRINEPFVYDACSGDQFIRHIVVGPGNPEFTTYNRISPYLPAAIWQSEDPSFMQHRGFVPESFRESIAQNFKEKRFARGGSTITMQLVKNVFLNRNKTISRKAEEALIVYLIENLGLVPKERMMEVYLNVIEWGPNVYGVSEAARFYFNKKPAELNLQECIFLAAIIPNPKYFRYQFDRQGEIKGYMADFFKIIEGRMVMRGYLSERDTVNFIPRVKLSGPALQMVVPMDSVGPVIDESLPE